MGEDDIIDSIPLAEADQIIVSEEDGSNTVQYAKGRENVSSVRSNSSLVRMESLRSHTQSELDEVTPIQPQTFTAGFKRLHSTKIFTQPASVASSKFEEKAKLSVLQISTISDGFNSGPRVRLSSPYSLIIVLKN